ncbi:MAG: BamA/TamA family outer membrane protein [Winogradskyella sp.]|uniref:BamA/TamA family outer membrane protein n=1 Tax=Winogradskyella sp. TaxID=1883156 RepID=UPI0025E27C05|nr:BamA/TamA family outer membrane protein [Winogradskyella sp.]NRB83501.1 BamA/TamA family outer membrane protein [Winogradskyella sp.]
MRSFLVFIIILLSFNITHSQQKHSEKGANKDIKVKIVPYLSYNRTYEFMFGAVPMVMYKANKKDTVSPESISGLMGIYTTNKTWFALAFSKLYLQEDHWRITIGAGLGTANSQFMSGGTTSNFIDYQTGADFLKLEVQRKIGKNLYFGANYMYTKFNNEFDFDTPVNEEVTLNGLGFVFLRDKRDNVYYPRKGSELNLNYTGYLSFMGNDDESSKIELKYNTFFKTNRANDVIALRAYGGFGLGEVPFNNLLVVEGTDLRGYSMGEYRGKQLIALQGEYRYNFKGNMGLVGFAGFGTIYGSNIESNNGKILPSIGAGYRYTAFPENKMNVGLDVAAGSGDWGIYFRIGEAF